MDARIAMAVSATSTDENADWADTLREVLDTADVSDLDRILAVAELADKANELLACTSFDGDDHADRLAAALDKMLTAAHDLAEEIATMREP